MDGHPILQFEFKCYLNFNKSCLPIDLVHSKVYFTNSQVIVKYKFCGVKNHSNRNQIDTISETNGFPCMVKSFWSLVDQ